MKKKTLLCLVTVVTALGLVACQQGIKQEMKTEQKVVEEGEASSEEITTEEEQEETKEEVKESSALQVKIQTKDYASEDGSFDVYGSYQIAKVCNEGYDDLQKSLDEWFSNYERNYETKVKELEDFAKDDKELLGDEFYGYTLNESLRIHRLDDKIVSFAVTENSYSGGAHGNSNTYGITFDVQTGEEITFDQLGDIKADVKAYIDQYIKEKREEGFSYQNYEDMIDSLLEIPKWYLTGEGLEIAFDPYEIASYAEGSTFIIIPYEEMKNFNQDLLSEIGMLIQPIDVFEKHAIDVDLDGKKEVLQIVTKETEEYMLDLEIHLDDEQVDLEIGNRLEQAYYTRTKDKKSYLLLSYDVMSDDFVTFMYDITDKKFNLVEQVEDARIVSISNEIVELEQGLDALGSYRGKRDFKYTNGCLEPLGERYIVKQSFVKQPNYNLVLKQDLEVSIREDGKMVKKTLKKGTVLCVVDFDYKNVIGFSLKDGTYGEIQYEKKDFEVFIDGISEMEIFEMLPYAG